jgi:hypothetical protein
MRSLRALPTGRQARDDGAPETETEYWDWKLKKSRFR